MGTTKMRAKQVSLTLIIFLLTIINAYAELPNHPLIRNCIRNFFGRTACFPEGHQFQQNLLNREQNPQDEQCFRNFMQQFSAIGRDNPQGRWLYDQQGDNNLIVIFTNTKNRPEFRSGSAQLQWRNLLIMPSLEGRWCEQRLGNNIIRKVTQLVEVFHPRQEAIRNLEASWRQMEQLTVGERVSTVCPQFGTGIVERPQRERLEVENLPTCIDRTMDSVISYLESSSEPEQNIRHKLSELCNAGFRIKLEIPNEENQLTYRRTTLTFNNTELDAETLSLVNHLWGDNIPPRVSHQLREWSITNNVDSFYLRRALNYRSMFESSFGNFPPSTEYEVERTRKPHPSIDLRLAEKLNESTLENDDSVDQDTSEFDSPEEEGIAELDSSEGEMENGDIIDYDFTEETSHSSQKISQNSGKPVFVRDGQNQLKKIK